jgi:T5SS/PEP-CTERM-associated repeat protein
MTVTGTGSTVAAPGSIQVGRFATGTLNVAAGGSVHGGVLVLSQGTLRGDGQIFDGVNNAGVVAPGNSPGTLHIIGDYTQTDSGITQIEIAGTTAGSQFDTLDITGRAMLDGKLDVSLINGFTPASGSVFQVLHAGQGVFGGFHNLSLPALPGELGWSIVYTGVGVFLSVQGALLPGDFNSNGVVDAADYVLWRKGAPLANDTSPGVQPDDYNVWRSRFGQSLSFGGDAAAAANVAVPEPATLLPLIVVAAGLRFRGRAA